jgi:hypothetical protein
MTPFLSINIWLQSESTLQPMQLPWLQADALVVRQSKFDEHEHFLSTEVDKPTELHTVEHLVC